MAYLREITRPCAHSGCARTATHEVVNWRNAPYGSYCKRHATAERVRLQVDEEAEARRDAERDWLLRNGEGMTGG